MEEQNTPKPRRAKKVKTGEPLKKLKAEAVVFRGIEFPSKKHVQRELDNMCQDERVDLIEDDFSYERVRRLHSIMEECEEITEKETKADRMKDAVSMIEEYGFLVGNTELDEETNWVCSGYIEHLYKQKSMLEYFKGEETE